MIVDLWMTYQFVRRLSTSFESWDAYKLGIIDEKGIVLKKRKDLTTREERNAFGIFDVMILNMKKMLEKLPGGSTKMASYAAALFLIKEWKAFTNDSLLTESVSDETIKESISLFSEAYSDYTIQKEYVKEISEDTITNNVSGGNVAGLGIGPDGEPGISQRRARIRSFRNFIKKANKEIDNEYHSRTIL